MYTAIWYFSDAKPNQFILTRGKDFQHKSVYLYSSYQLIIELQIEFLVI
jgi:hypothetical protein